MVNKLDIIDVYLTTTFRKGPTFTKQAHWGYRFDQARLDRAYASNRDNWFAYASRLEHDDRQTLSNHIPMTFKVELQEPQREDRRKSSYLKMDHNFLEDEEFKAPA